MKYVGSKAKIAKHLLPIILANRRPDQWYVEPFVGGSNMIDKVGGPRLGNDIDSNLIAMFRALQTGWMPPANVSRDEYYAIKANPQNYSPELVCFVSLGCSFGNKRWGGYAQNKKGTNYADVCRRNLLKQLPNIKDVAYTNQNYWSLNIPENSIVYCDPPYAGTVKYSKEGFNHEQFWEWVRHISLFHKVFVSEYAAPPDFECVLSVPTLTTMNKNSKDVRIEKLFRLRGS
jgi:DNA adenine methylase